MEAAFTCRYCGRECPEAERSPDHVVQAALGSELVEPDTCRSCNQRANREVDEPFIKELWIREQRHRHRIADRREGRVPDAPRIEGRLVDGTRVHSYLHRDGVYQHFLPTFEQVDEQTFRFGVDASELDELLAKKLERLRGQHGEVEVTKQERIKSPELVKHDYSLDVRL